MKVAELVASLGLDIDSASFKKGDAAISGMAQKVGGLAKAFFTGYAVKATFDLAHGFAEAGDAARKASQKLGVNSEALQRLQYAAGLADVNNETLAQGLRFLAKSGVKDVQGEFLKLAETFAAMPDDGEKTRLALEKFGKSGAELIPLLNGGREELEKLFAEAEGAGLIISPEQQKAGEEFNDQLTRVRSAIRGIAFAMGRAMLPAFKRFADIALAAAKGVKRFADFALEFADRHATAFKIALVILTGAVAGFTAHLLIAQGAAVAAAIKFAAAWLAAAAPFILIGAAIAGVALLIEDLYYFLTGGESVIGEAVDGWASILKGFGIDVAGWAKAVKEAFAYAFSGELISTAVSAWKGYVSQFFSWVIDGVKSLGARIVGGVKGALGFSNPFASGGAAGPAAAAALSSGAAPRPVTNANQLASSITINAAPGMSEEEIARKVQEHQARFWDAQMAHAGAGVE